MKPHDPAPSLSRLAALREREVERRQTELAQQLADAERRRRNQERLDQLWRTSTTTGTLTPQLSLNCANYKQTVLELADRHRDDLSRQEQAVDQARLALLTATRRHGAIDQVLTLRLQEHDRVLRSAEQKRQDEIARQSWLRRGT
ncbi:flagellar FliJ family protein [Pseudorhodoferax sp.]|uniref:flagellar FliJ family protein n=1 Tax=Pseudorhodoferax sp. TaxID=1993553 RepID=UPI002DD68DA9|nr:flagellar FliJ family protein [Pseudorhodoferax sp.]